MAITKTEFEAAKGRALAFYEKAHIAITDHEKDCIEVADFGLNLLEKIGVELLIYVNTQRVCAKEVVLFPWQICPEHRHPGERGEIGKEETFRCRWGQVYLYVEGPATSNPGARIPAEKQEHFTVWHEIILKPGDQHTVDANTLHWFQGGSQGAILSEFSTPSTDELDIFTDPAVKRIPEIV